MKNLLLGAFALAAVTVAAPVAAVQVVTFDFSGGPQAGVSLGSLGVTNSGVTLTATARRFVALPDTLAPVTDRLPGAQIRSPTPGIDVAGGRSNDQIDTNLPNAREAVLVSGSSSFSLRGFQLSEVDFNDILQIYGVRSNGTLVNLGFPGVIRRGGSPANASLSLLAGQATGPVLVGGVQPLTLVNPTSYFDRYLFTTRVGGDVNFLGQPGQGYRIDSLVIGVPEPESWALLIVGFGLIGVTARRRRTAVAA